MKKNIIFLSFLVFVCICGIFYPLTELLSKNKSKDLETLAIEKAKTAIKTITPSFNKAIENSDDINLITNIEFSAKTENITSCFILDQNSKVIIHNNISEWNTEKNADIYNKAMKEKTEFLQQIPDNKDFLLLSEPLSNDYTLFCMISIQGTKEVAKYWKIKYYTISASVAILITVILYFLSKLLILLPFNRIKKSLETKSSENIKNDKYNEITDIFVMERDKVAKKISMLEEDKDSLSKIIEYSQKASIQNSLAFIILNSSNKVVYAYDNTDKLLKKDFEKDGHILEISTNSDLIQIVSKANENIGTIIQEHIKNYTISAISIDNNGKIAGTIIKVE
jgi:hypothetical protein